MICVCGFDSCIPFTRCPECGAPPMRDRPRPPARPAQAPRPPLTPLTSGEIEPEPACVQTGTMFDALGRSGLPVGCVILLAGAPGLGKSSQSARLCARWPHTVLYLPYEERAAIVRRRIVGQRDLTAVGEVYADRCELRGVSLARAWGTEAPLLVIVDSLQTADVGEDVRVGSLAHALAVREQCGLLVQHHPACTVVIIGHVTKDDTAAGPRSIEHLVDVHCRMAKTKGGERVCHVMKNRMGPTGVFPALWSAATS